MTLIGGYRQSGTIARGSNAGLSGSQSIVNFVGFKPSGLAAGNALAVCLYVYSGTSHSGSGYPTNNGCWLPLKVEWLTG